MAAIPVHDETDHLRRVLEHVRELADATVVLDDRSTDPETLAILDEYQALGAITSLHRNATRVPRHEGRDRERLLQLALSERPDWIVTLDADEVFEPRMKDEIQRLVNPSDPSIRGYAFRVATFWDRDDRVRVDGHWGTMAALRLFNAARLSGRLRDAGRAFHASPFPAELDVRDVAVAAVRIAHYGYLDPVERERKFAFYTAQDHEKNPACIGRADYAHLVESDPEVLRFEHWNTGSTVPS